MHRLPLTSLPPRAGIGLRAPHHAEVLDRWPDAGWLEVHSENFYAAGGAALHVLDTVRERYPLSLHGVGMSLGSGEHAERHLAKLKALVERVEPAAVSEHLCWSSIDGRHFNDLLPLPYTEEALAVVCARVGAVQDALRRTILVENVSSYVEFAESTIPEWEFVAEVARRSGCGILLDVNNIYVSASNHGFDARRYLAAIPPAAVGEIHLAGYDNCDDFLVDTHGRPVQPEVWRLYEDALERFGPRPTLIEWDTDIPALAVLLGEAEKAERLLEAAHAVAA
jgi:hypothetical protein